MPQLAPIGTVCPNCSSMGHCFITVMYPERGIYYCSGCRFTNRPYSCFYFTPNQQGNTMLLTELAVNKTFIYRANPTTAPVPHVYLGTNTDGYMVMRNITTGQLQNFSTTGLATQWAKPVPPIESLSNGKKSVGLPDVVAKVEELIVAMNILRGSDVPATPSSTVAA
jgi:hypothetical protein